MRKAKSGPSVSEKRFFFLKGEKLPRVEVTVDDYYFCFTCGNDLAPIIISSRQPHGTITAKAYAVAAGLFTAKMMVNPNGGHPLERQPSLV